jgi:hypothetical protein
LKACSGIFITPIGTRDADCFISLWPCSIDLSFIRSGLDRGKGLAHYLSEDLPHAFEETFMGQSPLIFIKCDPQTILIVSPHALRHQGMVTKCGDISGDCIKRALDVLHRAKNIRGLGEMRAKELMREIDQAKAFTVETI